MPELDSVQMRRPMEISMDERACLQTQRLMRTETEWAQNLNRRIQTQEACSQLQSAAYCRIVTLSITSQPFASRYTVAVEENARKHGARKDLS